MSISALEALLGKKAPSSAVSAATSTAAQPATPVSVSSPAHAPTPVAAAQSSSAPAVLSAAAIAPAARPSGVATPEGGPPDALKALLGNFQANLGKAPRVNPPEAVKVLAGPTALEVAGHPEPPEVPEVKVAPVEKPAEVLAAEAEKKTRRTAAVVQGELDAAMRRIAELESTAPVAVAPALDQALIDASIRILELETENARLAAHPSVDVQIAAAVEMIQTLQAEAAVQLDDNRKAWARVAELELGDPPAAQDAHAPGERPTVDGIETRDLVIELFDRGYGVVGLGGAR